MMLIAVDTGNRCIKVPDIAPFTAGIYDNGTTEPMSSGEVLLYKGHYYLLTEQRAGYQRDKTLDETYFILVLFAIAKRIRAKQPGCNSYEKNVVLALGLPPSHCDKVMKEKYKRYFSNSGDPIKFSYEGIPFVIHIAYPKFYTDPKDLYDPTKCGVMVYPQGYSAAILRNDEILKYPESYVVDVGGYTTDVIKLVKYTAGGRGRLRVDMSFCRSFNLGIIQLFNIIGRKLTEEGFPDVSENVIDAVLQGSYAFSGRQSRVNEIVAEQAEAYAKKIITDIRENGANIGLSHPVFIGGGCSVLKKYILNAYPEFDEATYIPSITANAEGYAMMAKATLASNNIILESVDLQGVG